MEFSPNSKRAYYPVCRTLDSTCEDFYQEGYTCEYLDNGQICVDICPAGFYCPEKYGDKQVSCPKGHYCIEASFKPDKCLLGSLTCPNEEMDAPDSIILLILSLVVLVILVEGYRIFSRLKIIKSSEKFEKRSHANVDILQKTREEQRILLDAAARLSLSQEPERAKSLSHLHQSSIRIKKKPPKLKAIVQSKEFEDFTQKIKRTKAQQQQSTVEKVFELVNIDDPITVSFTNLNLFIKNDKKHILHNLFGIIRPYNITALVGTSGSGKTTLLNLLRGEASYASVSGDIHVNGKPVESLIEYQDQSAFVPQDDIMYNQLSVEECVTYAALLFNKREYRTKEECSVMVTYILNILGIEFVRHAVIGTTDEKSISGGQRKRVSVAMEMVKEAPLFFLDEPTSGLDSASSMSLLNTLKSFALKGANIVTTLHQPRQEILDVINCMILLGPGGHLIYAGPTIEMAPWFSKMGFTALSSTNVVDYAMDVLSGFVLKDGGDSPEDVEALIQSFSKNYLERNMADHLEFLSEEMEDIDMFTNRVKMLNKSTGMGNYTISYGKAPLWISFWVCCTRQRKLFDRSFGKIAFSSYILWIVGYVMVFLFGSVLLSPDGRTKWNSTISCVNLAFSMMVISEARGLFTNDYLVRMREESGGIDLLGLYIGKMVGNLMEVLFLPLSFTLGAYVRIESRENFGDMWLSYILLYLAISGLANLCAACFTVRNGNLVAIGACVTLWAFGGLSPTVPEMKSNMGTFSLIINYLSPFKWSFMRMTIQELSGYSDGYDYTVDEQFYYLQYRRDKLSYATGMLVVYWFVTNALAYFVLVWKRHDYEIWRDLKSAVFGDTVIPIPVDDDDELSIISESAVAASHEDIHLEKKKETRTSGAKSKYNKVDMSSGDLEADSVQVSTHRDAVKQLKIITEDEGDDDDRAELHFTPHSRVVELGAFPKEERHTPTAGRESKAHKHFSRDGTHTAHKQKKVAEEKVVTVTDGEMYYF